MAEPEVINHDPAGQHPVQRHGLENVGTVKSSQSETESTCQHNSLLLDLLFVVCSILDAAIVQPILFLTSEENVPLIAFYLN